MTALDAPLDQHVPQVGDQLVVAHAVLRHRPHHRGAHLRGRRVAGDRHVVEAVQELGVEPHGAIGQRAHAGRVPVEVGYGRRGLGLLCHGHARQYRIAPYTERTVKRTIEREIKLRAGAGFALPRELGDPLAPRSFSSTYHDTSDHRLAASGFTLRYRAEHGSGAWQLKLPRNGDRLELELPGSPESVPPPFGDLLAATTRGRPLAPVATLDTTRQGIIVRDSGRDLAEVVIDEVVVSRSGRRVSRIDELEVELVDGDDASLQRIERALRAAGALDADERPKLFRALGLVRPEGKPPRRKAKPINAPHRDAGGAVPGDPAARPGHPAGQRPRGAAPAPRRHPPAARPPAGGEADARRRLGQGRAPRAGLGRPRARRGPRSGCAAGAPRPGCSAPPGRAAPRVRHADRGHHRRGARRRANGC